MEGSPPVMLSEQPVGPSGGQVPCSGCGAVIDPLRAGHVAIFDARFHYFCNAHHCRARFLGQWPSPEPEPRVAPPVPDPVAPAILRPIEGAVGAAAAPPEVPEPLRVEDQGQLLEALPEAEPCPPEADLELAERRDVGGVLLVLATIAGVLAIALELANPTKLVLVAQALLVLVGASALVGRSLTSPPDPSEIHRAASSLPAALAALLPTWALLASQPETAARASFFAGCLVVVMAATAWLVSIVGRPVLAARRALERALELEARHPLDPNAAVAPEPQLLARAGETVALQAEQAVLVDFEVREGEAEVLPWPAAARPVRKRPGDPVVAGARLVSGQLRGVCTHAGMDRAFARSLLDPTRRCDVWSPLPKLARSLAQRWAWAAGLVAAVTVTVVDWGRIQPIALAMVVVAVWAAFANDAIATIGAASIARGVLTAAQRGIVYRDAQAWDRCARVTTAAFCARGTLLRGEPELAEVEAIGDSASAEEVIALAAGAYGAEQHPVAIALRRAARARGIVPDSVRNARTGPEHGIVAIASSGETICVGARAFLLDKRVSIASAEERLADLESSGRAVLLVARAGRLFGLLAFQDGLRAGARAAIQHLHEAHIEPVLLSADSRATCEAIGRSLDIEHLRAEIQEQERAEAVQRIKDAGATVAVIGHLPFDAAALGAADASVAMGGAGRMSADHSAALAGDDVRDAALALAVANRTRRQASQALALALAPAAFGALVVTARLLPPEYAPLALLLGTVTAVLQLLSSDRRTRR